MVINKIILQLIDLLKCYILFQPKNGHMACRGVVDRSLKFIKQKKLRFTLIEIVIAILILAIGVSSVMTLFPLNLQETKKSIGHNYSSINAESIFAYISRIAYIDNNWSSVVNNIPTLRPVSKFTNANWSTDLEGNLWDDEESDSDGIFGILVKSGSYNDFTGEVLIWKSKLANVPELGTDQDYTEAAAIYMEISWPVEKPYSQRQKNYYYMEIIKP